MKRTRLGVSVFATAGLVFLACGDNGISPNPDLIAPTVLSITPIDGATVVSIGAHIEVVFSEPVAFVSGNPTAVIVTFDNRSLPGAVYITEPSTVVFHPVGAFDPGTEYTVHLSVGVSDTAGNALEFPLSWTFATLGSPPPTVSQINLLEHIGRLSHDSMAGRGSGTDDERRAAEYIWDQFEQIGLDSSSTGYIQLFPVPADRVNGLTGVTSQNVLGVLPGEGDLSDEWIVVGGHYDHIGMREITPGTFVIYNGADDNASGTAMVLELARSINEYVTGGGTAGMARRSVLFQAFGAEEVGLLGSEYFCANPTSPLSTIAGMLNFDMIGRLRYDDLYVGGIYTSVEWQGLLTSRDPHQLDLIQLDGYLNSTDYACFRRNNVPTAWFFTGTHAEYHQPGDDVELINGTGIKQIGDIAAATLVHLMLRPQRIPFDRAVP